MVSTRQSSNVASSSDSYVPAGTSTEVSHSSTHAGGKLLRSGLSAPPALPMPSTSAHNEVALTNSSPHSPTSTLNLLDLPYEILDKIFSFLGYKNVAHLRPVCRQLDKVCQAILNSTFQRLQHQMLNRFQSIKAKMPRRESARRNHPLACESDIIETLHMRLTLLQMTFGKHIERKHCCFFAGEILDEVNRILHYVKVTPKLARPYKVTDELFDLSTMAMEFFKEHIEPTLPEIAYFAPSNKYFTLDSPSHGSKGYESPASGNEALPMDPQSVAQSNIVLRKRIKKIKQGMRRYNDQLIVMRRDLRTCKSKIADHKKQIVEYASRMEEYDKKNEETSRKFSTLLQELNKCKTELQYWRSKTPVIPPLCNNCGHRSFVPAQAGEPQSLSDPEAANNGFGLGLSHNPPLETIEFPAEYSSTKDEDFWNLYENKKEQKQSQMMPLPDVKVHDTGNSSKCGKGKEDKVSPSKTTPETSKNMKRKLAEDEIAGSSTKKPKRALKMRCASKRVKT